MSESNKIYNKSNSIMTNYFSPKKIKTALVLSLSQQINLKNTFINIDDALVNISRAKYKAKHLEDKSLFDELQKIYEKLEELKRGSP